LTVPGDPADPAPEDRAPGREMPSYTRAWHFDPYHQRLDFARRHDPGPADADTEWIVWEVFQQDHRGEHHRHVGSLHAPDAEFALVLAKENFARRGDCVNLWVVPAHAIHATDYEDADVFVHTTDKMYREPGGFHGLRKSKIHGQAGAAGRADAGEDDDRHVEAVLHSADEVGRAKRGPA